MPHNIEKSGFHRGEYVGYGQGTVWRIKRYNDGWSADPRDSQKLHRQTGKTLAELSTKIAGSQRDPGKRKKTGWDEWLKNQSESSIREQLRETVVAQQYRYTGRPADIATARKARVEAGVLRAELRRRQREKGMRSDRDQPIYTDEKGRPIERPRRENFSSDTAYIRAFHAYKDKIANLANKSFDEEFRSQMSRRTRRRKR